MRTCEQGRLGVIEPESLRPWNDSGSQGTLEPGSLAWGPRILGSWEPGSLGAWEPGSLGALMLWSLEVRKPETLRP